MDKNVEALYKYVSNVFSIEHVYFWSILTFREIVDELNAHPLQKEPPQEYLDEEMSKRAGTSISSYRLGIDEFDSAVIPHAKAKGGLFRKGLTANGYTLSFDELKEQCLKCMGEKLKKQEQLFKEANVQIPDFVMDFYHDLNDGCSAELQGEFCSRLKECENMKDVFSVCDAMRKSMAIEEMKRKIDDMSANLNSIGQDAEDIQMIAKWLALYSLFK